MSGLRFGLSLSMQGRGGKAWRDYHLFETGSGFLYDFSRADALFQEATGITPVAVDQNVGLALDISKWGGKTLAQVLAGQPELVVNGDFATGDLSGWTVSGGNGSIAYVNGKLRVSTSTTLNSHMFVTQAIPTVIGRWYRLVGSAFTISGVTTSKLVRKADNTGASINAVQAVSIASGNAVDGKAYLQATASTTYVILQVNAPGSVVEVDFDNISVKEIPGNHAPQATSGARPVLKAGGLTRYDGVDDNLLTTFKFDAGGKGSLALKFNKAVGNSSQILIGARNASTDDVILVLEADGRILANVGTGANLTGGSNRAGQTAIAVLTWDGTTVNLYSDEGLLASQSQSGSVTIANAVALAASSVASLFASVDIYQALAINRALTPAEIVKLTNSWMNT